MPTIKKMQKRKRHNKTFSRMSAQTYYNTKQWKSLRKAYFQEHPLCEMCEREGKITPTEEIHHIKPISSGSDELARKDLAFDYNNLMALCAECHRKIHRLMNKSPD